MPTRTAHLRDIVVRAIAAAAQTSPDAIADDANLLDLGLDSLNLAGILIDIEDGLGAEIPAEVLDRFLDAGDVITVQDVITQLSAWEPSRADDAYARADGPYGEIVVVQQM